MVDSEHKIWKAKNFATSRAFKQTVGDED